ncbi:MAG: alpha-galactosidase, partial [Bacteroidales bacterium]|nr:alpha-galactosidase [Bacteroidales bacterium]
MKSPVFRTLVPAVISILLSAPVSSGADGSSRAPPGDGLSETVDAAFARGTLPPFSFDMDGVPSSKFIKKWDWKRTVVETGDPSVVARTFTYAEPESGLEISCNVKGYVRFDAVEWVCSIRNTSGKDSPRLSSFKVADTSFKTRKAGDFKIHYAEGNHISKSDYSPREMTFEVGSPLRVVPSDGRSSSEGFPFFCLESVAASKGAIVAIGWTGTWFYEVEKLSPKLLSLELGQRDFDLYLKAGEEIRQHRTERHYFK